MASDREALRKLANEVTAVIAMAEPELRHVCGNTNFALLTQRRDEAYAALAAPPSAPHDYAALADRLADFRFGSVLKPDGTERDPKEWLAFEPELMRVLRDLASPLPPPPAGAP